MASSCHAPPLCHGVISDDSSHNKSLHGSIAEQKDDRSLERSSHLVRADRGGGDKKSRCSLYSTVRPHPFPESFQPLFDTLTCKSSYSIFCIFNVFVWEVWLWWLQVRGILFKFMVVKFQLESRSPRRPQDTEGRSPSLHVSEFWSLSWGYHIRL